MTRRMRRQLKLNKDANCESEVKKQQRMCGSKKEYNSDLEALAWGRVANEKYNQDRVWDTYFCQFCRKWHLTNTEK